jgi:maltooligosyltrehalose trehalohydrolase
VSTPGRRYPVGAEVRSGGVHFRVWAPRRKSVSVVVDDPPSAMERDSDGYFAALVKDAAAGSRYGFRLDDQEKLFPDPASRWQPEGPHELSAVVDADVYPWGDAAWRGIEPDRTVLYELHVGTFTADGTWRAAEERLRHLKDAGVTTIEMMPVAEFPGRFGWGYDGVELWAPSRLYGQPDDLRHFIDAAHRLELAVLLDVVYNHLGPSGNYLKEFSLDYFTDRYENEWGEALNFDGPGSAPVREFFSLNAAYWIDEYHFDGLRIDATQSIHDHSSEHLLAVISRRARAAARGRRVYLVAENEPQDTRTLRSVDEGGYGLDAMWNDDFHHSARVALTGITEAYYTDYNGKPQELVSMAKHGFLYQGQWYRWQKKRRGTSSIGTPRHALVWYLQNHDQIANSACGDRLRTLTDPAALRAMTALVLLGPATPLIFQGDEIGALTPFTYFADHEPELAELVTNGRREFLQQFPSLATDAMQSRLPRPDDPAVFARCKLDWSAIDRQVLALHRDLLRIRRDDPLFRADPRATLDGAVLDDRAFLLRSLRQDGDDRLLIVNLGPTLRPEPIPEPLLAPPPERTWRLLWSSEAPEYGGSGTPEVETSDGRWSIPARSCVLLGTAAATGERQ